MHLSTRNQRGLSVSARTITYDVWRIWPPTGAVITSGIENLDRAVWLRVRACPTS
jgi:hypothetical protein